MRRAAQALPFVLWLVLVAGIVAAQTLPQVGDLPTGDGKLTGRVRQSNGIPIAGIDISLIAFEADGQQGLRRIRSADDGRFQFDAISPDPKIVYFVVAQSDGVHHSERTSFVENQNTLDVDVRIAPTSTTTRRARRGDTQVRIERSCSGLRVTETHAVSNRTRSVLFVPEDARDGALPMLDLVLPEGASELASPFGAQPLGLARDGQHVRFWGPLYPGDQKIEFSYTLQAPDGTAVATWGYPKGARRLIVLADPSVPNVGVDALPERSAGEVFGREHRRFESEWLEDGALVRVTAELGRTASLGTIREAQLWIELDDAALKVDERLALEPSEDADASSLMCIALPPDATDLGFSQTTLALPIGRDPSGALEIRGPLPPGEQVITLSYQLPSEASGARFARRFGVPVPLLAVLVSDTGVIPETTRLHRRRPVRRVERNYLHLEAFQVEADELVEINFARVAAPQGLPRGATAGFAIVVAGGLLAFLGAPLRGREEGRSDTEGVIERLRAERESVYAAVRDVEEDFATGKLTVEDHDELRAELRARAVQLLAAEQRGGEAPPAPVAKPVSPPAPKPPNAPPVGSEPRPATPAEVPAPSPRAPETAPPGVIPAGATAKPSLARPYKHPAGSYGAARKSAKPAVGETQTWRFCPSCGGNLPDQPRFCPHCGEGIPRASGDA